MQLTGKYEISLPREQVWKALNDPDILRQSIPGCQDLTKTSDTAFEALVIAKVGPVRAKFTGKVELTDLNPPESYTISGEGKGGAAGFAKGGAKVVLTESDHGGTILSYTVEAMVGGKLAQIGQRLIDATAKKMADEFFTKFSQVIEGGAIGPEVEPVPSRRGLSGWVWAAGLIIIVALVLWYFNTAN